MTLINEPQILETCLRHFAGLEAIYLFGSFGQGEAGASSDLDLGLMFDHQSAKALGNLSLSDAALELSRVTGLEVDLVNLRGVSTLFQHQIITTGKLLYQAPGSDPFAFEGLVLSLYQKLKEERAPIEKAIRQSGEVYAQ